MDKRSAIVRQLIDAVNDDQKVLAISPNLTTLTSTIVSFLTQR